MSTARSRPKTKAKTKAAKKAAVSRPTPPERPAEGLPGAPALFLPKESFPPYRFVPGHAPHPFAHKGGYAYGQRPEAPPFRSSGQWKRNRAFLRGVDFFNRGWWWEAHEAWESYWHVTAGRDSQQHDLFKGLIQLAACALNRERRSDEGAGRLLFSAITLLEKVDRQRDAEPLCGLVIADVVSNAHKFLAEAVDPKVGAVNGLYLRPE
jgi:hypothetical protein